MTLVTRKGDMSKPVTTTKQAKCVVCFKSCLQAFDEEIEPAFLAII
jgi:hypothetical protein